MGKRSDAILAPINQLNLGSYVDELEEDGYTVVPPHVVGSPGFVERVRDAVLRVAELRTGVKQNIDRDGDHGSFRNSKTIPDQFILFQVLLDDPVFEEWLENPVLVALVNYLLRDEAHLSGLMAFVKWRGKGYAIKEGRDDGLGLHTDSPRLPGGAILGDGELITNNALVLTEYTRENGALAVVPGSHKLRRAPHAGEGIAEAIPVEAAVGSLILWKGGTWHGAFPKTTHGLRLNLTGHWSNRHLTTYEAYQHLIPREMLARRSAQFARYVGAAGAVERQVREVDLAEA